ncbi:DUF1758 domain-containing protein [Trichonephila clavata]|uniref:DUF1758 domain-containing protein n=1 Tax=Trichonephila clavata TaxID=2740835 RepID=A0A8X6K6X6_TRICU|nr:DUF1758 domain-containing protein [Trichonephila clavata]
MQNIDNNLQKFGEIETINEAQKPLSKEEEYCENHYQMTHTRNEASLYIVQMPTKDIQGIGHSKDSYGKLMLLGYADASESAYGAVVYLHCVKEDGTTTTKLIASKSRVVKMAERDDDVFFAALENQCKIIESALQSKCNMNQQIREEARQVLGELKSSVFRNFVMIKSEKFVEA